MAKKPKKRSPRLSDRIIPARLPSPARQLASATCSEGDPRCALCIHAQQPAECLERIDALPAIVVVGVNEGQRHLAVELAQPRHPLPQLII